MQIDFLDIVARAWQDYDSTREVHSVDDISVLVSTNHVFRCGAKRRPGGGQAVILVVEHFVEDHSLINALANNAAPFDSSFHVRC